MCIVLYQLLDDNANSVQYIYFIIGEMFYSYKKIGVLVVLSIAL